MRANSRLVGCVTLVAAAFPQSPNSYGSDELCAAQWVTSPVRGSLTRAASLAGVVCEAAGRHCAGDPQGQHPARRVSRRHQVRLDAVSGQDGGKSRADAILFEPRHGTNPRGCADGPRLKGD